MFNTFERISEILREENRDLLQHIDKTKCFLIGFPRRRFLLKDVDPYLESVEEIKKVRNGNIYGVRTLGNGNTYIMGNC